MSREAGNAPPEAKRARARAGAAYRWVNEEERRGGLSRVVARPLSRRQGVSDRGGGRPKRWWARRSSVSSG